MIKLPNTNRCFMCGEWFHQAHVCAIPEERISKAVDPEVTRLRAACSKINESVSQVLGKALGYPAYKDDQKNFPGTTEADGVCVGDQVAESLADEAAAKIASQQEEINTYRQAKPKEEWHEDDGVALWWFFPIMEPPYCGTPLDEDFNDSCTHWTVVPTPVNPNRESI